MNRIITLMILLVLNTELLSQIKLVEKQEISNNREGVIITPESIIYGEVQNGQKNVVYDGKRIGVLAKDEQISYFKGSNFYTVKNSVTCHCETDKLTVAKYIIEDGKISQLQSIEYDSYETSVKFFKNGSYIVKDEGEAGGYEFKFYSSDMKLLASYSPYEGGFSASTMSFNGDKVLIGITPNNKQMKPLVALFDDAGKDIFKSAIESEGFVVKVLASEHHFSVYTFFVDKREHRLTTYDINGNVLWTKIIDSDIQTWHYHTGNSSTLVVASFDRLLFYNASDGRVQGEKILAEVFSGAGGKHTRNDKYIVVHGVQTIPGKGIAVLISEPTGVETYATGFLTIYNESLGKSYLHYKVGDIKGRPILMVNDKQLSILIASEILKYSINE
ncbi:hypothetical protein JMN32_20515 [Fulvivirga sp. 29W222]|uniref:Uncharacterized protein n=1 Tax=Fulvivirga marina TaxID=2494733 RepID=A0A937G1D9_9BACT|nr:hypothetical protein [Fulvivirga marina]MBL6448708.1 hypothetical protein [Fulvivirga marina]